MQTLDITNFKQKGRELVDAITTAVKPYNNTSLVGVSLPANILMTQAQYDNLMQVGNLPNMYHTEDRMFMTPYNVMEVKIKDRKKLTFEEAHSLNDKDFKQWEKSVEGERDD